jgi:hypothetical protein
MGCFPQFFQSEKMEIADHGGTGKIIKLALEKGIDQ